jgi:hypothetical protein
MFRICPACDNETLHTLEAVYDGFVKKGEAWTCSVCGTAGASGKAETESKTDPLAALFGDDPASEDVDLFDVEAETARSCRKCTHYVIHPFTQRCALHDKEVAATDVCPDFTPGKRRNA